MGSLSKVEPFSLACEFLMDEEIETIKKLISKIETHSKGTKGFEDVKQKFNQLGGL